MSHRRLSLPPRILQRLLGLLLYLFLADAGLAQLDDYAQRAVAGLAQPAGFLDAGASQLGGDEPDGEDDKDLQAPEAMSGRAPVAGYLRVVQPDTAPSRTISRAHQPRAPPIA